MFQSDRERIALECSICANHLESFSELSLTLQSFKRASLALTFSHALRFPGFHLLHQGYIIHADKLIDLRLESGEPFFEQYLREHWDAFRMVDRGRECDFQALRVL